MTLGTQRTSKKGHLYANLEGTYGSGTGPGSLSTSHISPVHMWNSRRVPNVVEIEGDGNAMAGMKGLGVVNCGYHGEYDGAILLREFTVPSSDSSRPNWDRYLLSAFFGDAAHDNPSGSVYTFTYDLDPVSAPDSLEYAWFEYCRNGNAREHQVTGGRHNLRISMVHKQPVLLEILTGKALTHARANETSAVQPDVSFTGGASPVPFVNSTATLKVIGGSTFDGQMQACIFDFDADVVMVGDAAGATGNAEVHVNLKEATFTIRCIGTYSDYIRGAFEAGDYLDYEWSIPGPATSTNLFKGRCYGQIRTINETDGEGDLKEMSVEGQVVFGDRSSNTDVARNPSESPVQLVWQSGS